MKSNLTMFTVAVLVGVLLLAFVLTLVALGVAHPVPWIILAVMIAIPLLSSRLERRHFVQWRDEYSVGIKLIDDDHRTLLHLINQLQTAVHYHTGDMFEKQALDAVVDYTKYHFQREEELMAKHDYPLLEAHKAEHERMIAKVGGYISSYEKTGHKALEDLGDFLKDWLVNHINGTDKAYGPFLNERGVH